MDELITNQQIVDKCNALARRFYEMNGYEVDEEFKFYESSHPQEIGMWTLAVAAFDFIEGTDVESALDDLEER